MSTALALPDPARLADMAGRMARRWTLAFVYRARNEDDEL